ncbi:MAG TPA: hypothetical protein VJ083_09120 [Sedimentibacter sp.]|nr:hypothetical protein [Sedimentibacter sp.]
MKIKDIITIVIIAFMIIAMLLVFPFGKLYITPFTSDIGKSELFGTGNINDETFVMQEFYPRMEFLNSISIVIQNLEQVKNGSLKVSFYDEWMTELSSTNIPLDQLENYEYQKIEVNQVFIPGERYFFTIKAFKSGNELLQLCAINTTSGAVESGQYWYNGSVGNMQLAVQYEYANSARSIGESIPFWGFILVIATTLILVIQYKKKRENVECEQ